MSLSPSPCNKPGRSASPQLPAQPDHFYGSEDIQLPPSPHSDSKPWMTPEDDPLAHRGIPVFKPTMEEFQDFEEYVTRLEGWGMRSGIVKIIPPKEWSDSLPPLKDQLSSVKIQRPIEQHMLGRGGLFRQENIEKRKFMSVREWAELCSREDFRAPSVSEVGVHGRGAYARVKPTRTRGTKRANAAQASSVKAPTIKQEEEELVMDVEGSNTSNPIVVAPADPPLSPASQNADLPAETVKEEVDEKPNTKRRRGGKKTEGKQAVEAAKQAHDAEFLKKFDPHKDWLPPGTNAEDYTREFCQELERKYWRNLGLGKPAWYGADSAGSLFTEDTQSWNVAHLHSTLSRLLPADNQGLPGVNTPYLYFGMWRATFAWHVEDMDLFSINYIHFGAPKFWYAIPQGRANALEQTMRSYFPKDPTRCPQFLRHKSFLASPTLLAQSSVRPNYLVQKAGEFVITFPRGYHAGFNLGFNCAESVNFALDSWLEIGRRAKACQCISDSVRIDVDQLLHDRAAEVAADDEVDEEEEEIPIPEPMKPKRASKQAPAIPMDLEEPRTKPQRSPKKRKADVLESTPPAKKLKIKFSAPQPPAPSALEPSSKSALPKVSLTLKIGPRPVDEPYPCCLCVSLDKEGLLRVHEPPTNRKDAVEAVGNPKQWMAHEYCARIVPETWVDQIQHVSGVKERVVFGVDGIVKDRWNLKCSVCTRCRPKVHGAPIQCTKGKCPKAFHVSCAREGLSNILFSETREVEKEVVLLDTSSGTVPTGTETLSRTPVTPAHAQHGGSDNRPAGTAASAPDVSPVLKVVKKLEVQVLCPQHNPAVAAAKKANKMDKIKTDLLSLPSMARIKIRVSSGVFEVSLIRVVEETCSVEVLWDRGTKREFKWGSVVFGSTDGPVQQKPSEFIPEVPHPGLPIQAYSPLAVGATNPPNAVASSSKQPAGSQNPPFYAGGTTYDYWNYMKAYGYPGYYPPGMQYNPYAYAQHQYPHAQQLGWQQATPYYTAAGQQQVAATSLPQGSAAASGGSGEQVTADQQNSDTIPSPSEAPVPTGNPPSSPDSTASSPSQEETESLDLTVLANMQPDQLAKLLEANPEIRNMIIAAISKQPPEEATDGST